MPAPRMPPAAVVSRNAMTNVAPAQDKSPWIMPSLRSAEPSVRPAIQPPIAAAMMPAIVHQMPNPVPSHSIPAPVRAPARPMPIPRRLRTRCAARATITPANTAPHDRRQPAGATMRSDVGSVSRVDSTEVVRAGAVCVVELRTRRSSSCIVMMRLQCHDLQRTG